MLVDLKVKMCKDIPSLNGFFGNQNLFVRISQWSDFHVENIEFDRIRAGSLFVARFDCHNCHRFVISPLDQGAL